MVKLHRWVLAVALSCSASAWSATVSLAGLAYSGDFSSVAARFPYSRRVEPGLDAGGMNSPIRQMVAQPPPTQIELDTAGLAEITSRVRTLYRGSGNTGGILGRFVQALGKANLPAEAISAQTGAPILPDAKGYAIGQVMSMRIADGSVYSLKLPEPDDALSVGLTKFGRFEHGRSSAGTSFIYASKAQLKLQQPLSDRVYLDTELKNGVLKYVALRSPIANFGNTLKPSPSPAFTKLNAGAYVVTNFPGNAKNVYDTLSYSTAFAKSHEIPVPVDATKALAAF